MLPQHKNYFSKNSCFNLSRIVYSTSGVVIKDTWVKKAHRTIPGTCGYSTSLGSRQFFLSIIKDDCASNFLNS